MHPLTHRIAARVRALAYAAESLSRGTAYEHVESKWTAVHQLGYNLKRRGDARRLEARLRC